MALRDGRIVLALAVVATTLLKRAPSTGRFLPQALVAPLVETPRRMLTLPQDQWLGPGWDIVFATLPRHGADSRAVPLSLMLDSGLTTSMLAPPVASFLGLDPSKQQEDSPSEAKAPSFFAADGKRGAERVLVSNMRCGGVALGDLTSFVTDFPQRQIGAQLGWHVDGMLGMEFYERFGVETDRDCLRLYAPDDGSAVAEAKSMEKLSLTRLQARLLGVEVASPAAPRGAARVLGILDTGAAHTVLNWAAAAALLGLRQDDPSLAEAGSISASDIGGRPIDMPIVEAELELRGAGKNAHGVSRFKPIEVALGNIALFARLVGDESEPVALVGQDLLTQRATLFSAQQRLLCFGGA